MAFFKCPEDLVLLSEEDLLDCGLGSLVSQLDTGWPWVSHLGSVILSFLISTWLCTRAHGLLFHRTVSNSRLSQEDENVL